MGWLAGILALFGVITLFSGLSLGVGLGLVATALLLGTLTAALYYRASNRFRQAYSRTLDSSARAPTFSSARMQKDFEDVERSYEAILAMRCDACGGSYGIEMQALHQSPRGGYYDLFDLRCHGCGRKRIYRSDLPHFGTTTGI